MLTVPHAYCIDGIQTRHCDILAGFFADAIESAIIEEGLKVKKYKNNKLRAVIDMNRYVSRETSYRENIDEKIARLGKKDVLVDVHSAPGDTFDFPFDVYFLSMKEFTGSFQFNNEFHKFLKSNGVNSYLLKGQKRNDITYRAIKEYGLYNVSLIEINELTDEKRVKEIAKLIAWFLMTKKT